MKARILLVGAENLYDLLAAENFDVESGLPHAYSGSFDLIILDEAPAVCGELRRKGIDTSILMVTEEHVSGLKLGADDCVTRGCDSSELLARVEALLRRVPRACRKQAAVLRFGDVEVDFRMGEARKGTRPLNMTSKELRLLQYLVDHQNRVVSRKELLKNVWEYDAAISSRTIDVHIGWLRQKIEENPQQPRYLKTIRGMGYRFDPGSYYQTANQSK